MITTAEKIGFWLRFTGIQLLYALVILAGYILFPVAYFLRYVLKIKKGPLWIFLNDETDFGEDWWREREGFTKNNFWVALRWWVRNPNWNFILLFSPKWKSGETDVFEAVKNTLFPTVPESINKWIWANKDIGIYGTNHLYYKIKGTTYGRYSYATKRMELQLGSAGNRYKLRFKL